MSYINKDIFLGCREKNKPHYHREQRRVKFVFSNRNKFLSLYLQDFVLKGFNGIAKSILVVDNGAADLKKRKRPAHFHFKVQVQVLINKKRVKSTISNLLLHEQKHAETRGKFHLCNE